MAEKEESFRTSGRDERCALTLTFAVHPIGVSTKPIIMIKDNQPQCPIFLDKMTQQELAESIGRFTGGFITLPRVERSKMSLIHSQFPARGSKSLY